jgi:hypothetical protein
MTVPSAPFSDSGRCKDCLPGLSFIHINFGKAVTRMTYRLCQWQKSVIQFRYLVDYKSSRPSGDELAQHTPAKNETLESTSSRSLPDLLILKHTFSPLAEWLEGRAWAPSIAISLAQL